MVQAAARTRRPQPTPQPTPSTQSAKPARVSASPLSLKSPSVQPKLTVNPPGDRYEQEADAVAHAVMHSPAPLPQPDTHRGSIQRMAAEEDSVQRQTEDESCPRCQQRAVQRQSLQDEPVQRKGDGHPRVSPSTAATIRNPGSGSPLAPGIRHRVEPQVGANLSGVRVHTGPSAHRAAASLNARAFTHGPHIFLNRSESSHNLGLMAHEATHVVQQGAAPIQRQPMGAASAVQTDAPPAVQRLLPSVILEELDEYARHIPGYTLFTVIIGFNPLTGRDVPRNATNVLEGLMGLVPFGTFIFDKLRDYGILASAFAWVDGELTRLDLSVARIERTLEAAWDDVSLIEGFDYNLAVLRRHFGALYDDVVAFATSLVDHIIELVKEAAIAIAEPLLAENQAWALIKKIIKYDPLRDEPVEASTVDILSDFLRLIGKEQELQQMQERGTLQETADWLDTQFAIFTALLGELRGLVTAAWNAIQPENLPNLATNLQTLATQVGGFLQRVWDFALTVAVKVLELIKQALLGWLSTFATDVPGYRLMTVMLGRDPFTQEEVPRNATNLIRGFMGLIPGGEQQFQQMQESGVIPQAAQRIEAMMAELGITWPFVQQLFLDLWNAFTIEDLLNPVDAFIRILNQFQEPLGRLFTFVIEVIKVVLELILVMMNFPTDLIGSIIGNALQALDDIQRDPVGFLINLLQTAKLGFQKFFDNIAEHLIGGLTNWLFRAVRDAGIEPPADLSFQSILGFVLDVLGLTMDHMWELLANHIGQERVDQIRGAIERVMAIAREAWGFIQDVQERGIVAVWEYIQSQLTNLWDVVLQQVQSYVMERVINVGMRWLLSLLDATGITPVINSFVAFFNAIQSAIEYLRDMLGIVNDFVSTVASIAAGDIEPGAARMEQGLGNSIPIVIGFIANQLGLGNISERLGEIIQSIRDMVDRALNWLIEQALRLGRSVLQSLGLAGGDATHPTASTGSGEERVAEVSFSAAEHSHQIWIDLSGSAPRLMIASGHPTVLPGLLEHFENRLGELRDEEVQRRASDHIRTARSRISSMGNLSEQALDPRRLNDSRATERLRDNLQTLFSIFCNPRNFSSLPTVAGVSGGMRADIRVTINTTTDPALELPRQTAEGLPAPVGVQEDRQRSHHRTAGAYWSLNSPSGEGRTTERTPGVVFVPSAPTSGSTRETVRALTWATGDNEGPSNASHAEHHFVVWFNQQSPEWQSRVVGIEIRNIPYSPCQECIRELILLRNTHPNIQTAIMAWSEPYIATGQLNRPLQTRPGDLSNMRQSGWVVYPDASRLANYLSQRTHDEVTGGRVRGFDFCT